MKDEQILNESDFNEDDADGVNMGGKFEEVTVKEENLEPIEYLLEDVEETIETQTFTRDKRQLTCDICEYKTLCCVSLKMHNLIAHSSSVNSIHLCSLCNYECKNINVLQAHMLTHAKKTKQYYCNLCNYETNLNSSLKSHMRTHTKEKPFACNLCDYRGSQRTNLRMHMRTHTKEKPYLCSVCDYRSTQISNLKLHMMMHSDDRPYACDRCNYRARIVNHLRIHMMRHTKEKPFACKLCKYKGRQANHLKTHMKRQHSNEIRYSCSACDFTCSKRRVLKEHVLVHMKN